ncbi:hypothetical protein K7432_005477 [Basidiobolus ranarum]|uniref:Phosphoacetylglucosamine mutase n=1 Tax=Basidiobolus ranarum TaxID=34480 RepID=A0ABR2WWM5_9FUNG
MSFDLNKIKQASATHPKPEGITFEYGTAGFRMKAELLDSVIFRAALLAVLRSKKLDGKTIGIMITASHNPEPDNGVKIVDPLGEMLEQSWEAYATKLANASTDEELVKELESIVSVAKIDLSKPARIVFARDTRPSGPALVSSLIDGLKASDAEFIDHQIKTTPQLHYVVRCLNTSGTPEAYGEPTEEGYYNKLAVAFKKLTQGKQKLSPLFVDCANGVGAPKLRDLAQVIGEDTISVKIVNDNIDTLGKLNHQCGADFVKVNQTFPSGLTLTHGDRACAYDGDADRIVYFYVDSDNKTFKLLDGDKISGLASMYIRELVQAAGLEGVNVGVVQTAYANGSSTAYLTKDLGLPVSFACTGVKHLHHEAEKYDVGVYFEANGHGTVVFSPQAMRTIHTAEGRTPAQASAIEQLRALTEVINQAVGDAISDMLLVEAILTHRQWSLKEWDQAYTDLPSRLGKVVVSDRTIFKPIKADTVLASPEGLQSKIEQLVAKYNNGRSFVRPSGTEDVVRVYAEAATRHECDELAFKVAGLVFDQAGGKGDRPREFL